MDAEMNSHELALLRHLNGGPAVWHDGKPIHWGAAVSVVSEWLRGHGYITHGGHVTEKGKEAIAKAEGKP